jgi:hypothetical protein
MTGLSFTDRADKPTRFTGIIWGKVGAGKTPLAITAPDPILYILFDHDGDKSVRHVSHRYKLLDLTGQSNAIVDEMITTKTVFFNDLCKQLATGYFKSIVFDSLTAFLERALTRGVDIVAPTVTRGVKPTYIQPQLSGYGARGAIMRMCAATLHEAASKYNVSLVFTAHEANVYERNEKGESELVGYTLMLPGEAAVQVPKNLSEILLLRDWQGERRIYCRDWGKYSPMRSRMFAVPNETPYFIWKFNADKWEGSGIEDWLKLSNAANGHKIPMPK